MSPVKRTVTDDEGTWEVLEYPSGATTRTLIIPSVDYETQLQASREARIRADLPRRIAHRRWEAEISGTTFAGMPIQTDRDAQGLLTGAVVSLMLDPEGSIRWKTGDGSFVTLDLPTLSAVLGAVRAHVQACFDREDELLQFLEEGEPIEAILAAMETGWP